MFLDIARFELRYQLRNPVFWVVAVLFFLLTFGSITIDGIQIGGGSNVNANSPMAIATTCLVMTVFFMFVTTAFVANVVVRDDDSGFGPMVRSTQVSKFSYLIGRFVGAFFAAAIAFIAVPMGLLIGSFMPWLDPEILGPTVLSQYVSVYLFLALPSLFLTAAIFFAVACATRSMMMSYIGVVVFLVLYFTLDGIASGQPDLRDTAALLEPFGLNAFSETTRYWTAAQYNSQLPAMEGTLLYNRLLMIALALVALGIAYTRYSFAEKGISKRAMRRQAKLAEKLAKVQPTVVATLPEPRPAQAWRSRFMGRAGLEMSLIFRSPSFFVLIIIGLLNATGGLLYANELYGTPAIPMTFSLLNPLAGTFSIIPLIIAIFYAGELVWRDREKGMHEIIDATSLPNWAYLAPKTLAVATVLLVSLLISVAAAVAVQLIRGYTNLELDKYFAWYIVPLTVDMVLLAVLAVVFQAISPSKYVGWGLMVLYVVASITLASSGFEHPFYDYGSTGASPISDLNGKDVGSGRALALRTFWSGVALILAVIAHLLWNRGTALSLGSRLRRAPAQLKGWPGVFAGVGLLTTVVMGGWIYQQMNVINTYWTSDAAEQNLADYEKKFLQYEDLRQPSITDVRLEVDLYPYESRAEFRGSYELVNDTGAPVEELHVRLQDSWTELLDLQIPGAVLERDEYEEFGYRIYRFETPLPVDARLTLSFESERVHRGFRATDQDTSLVRNGTFLNNFQFAPVLGFDRSDLLQDRQTRRKYDLPAELRMPALEDDSARDKNYIANADWVMSNIVVSTAADQVPIAPGERISDTTVDGRRTVRFRSSNPILNFFSVQSAAYDVGTRDADGVTLEVFHHPSHNFNVQQMLDALETSLAYYRTHFGPYQFDYARIIEFPGYANFAQAFAGTIPFSETLGFIASPPEGDDIDYVTFVTAHEAAHQYWAHQLISAYMQGGTMLVESLAEYSAIMVMEELYGADAIRRFLKYDVDRYLGARGFEAIEEVPLIRVENQGYIHYFKGGSILYLLQERLGAERMNGVLADLLDEFRFKSQPYASSKDLLTRIKALARDEREARLIEDSLEKITLYDFKAESATVTELDDGRFETLLTVSAGKMYADGLGEETEASFDQLVEVGVFTDRPGFDAFDSDDVLIREWREVRSGEQELRIVTTERPAFAGIDPFTKYIDKNADDNIVAVE